MSHASWRAASLVLLGLAVSAPAVAQTSFTILHTNDFQGALEPSGSNPGAARVAHVINDVRAAVGADNVLLVDAGDMMQGSLLSNLQHGLPAIDYYRTIGYDAAAIGNHEFDWGQVVLGERHAQATAPAAADEVPYPFLAANVVSGSCDPGNWTIPSFAQPYVVLPTAGGAVRVALIGVTTPETPNLVSPDATAGLCFKDPAESISHYYDQLVGTVDMIVVLSHLGYTDGGYGYGYPVYGDQTLAQRLIRGGRPVPLIIGGHSHTNLPTATVVRVSGLPGETVVTQAYYGGRRVGRADVTIGGTEGVSITWTSLTVATTGDQDPAINSLVSSYASDPDYLALVNTPVLYSQVDLFRNYNGESMTGSFVADSVYGRLNSDTSAVNDVDAFLINAGGLRYDWCYAAGAWSNLPGDCEAGAWSNEPLLLTYAHTYSILPFGNNVMVGTMTGAKILEVLDQSATLTKGALQPSGLHYKFTQTPFPYAYDVCVVDRSSGNCESLDLTATYRVGTVDFLFGGGDGFMGFRAMTDVTAWGDVLDAVNAWASAHYTFTSPYLGPNGNGTLDGRIVQTAAGDTVPPLVTITSPASGTYTRSTPVTISFSASDSGSGVWLIEAMLDGTPVTSGLALDMYRLALGAHTLAVSAYDRPGNKGAASVVFQLEVTISSLADTTLQMYTNGSIDSKGLASSLTAKLQLAMTQAAGGNIAAAKAVLKSFIAAVSAQSGKHITADAAALLIGDANWLIDHL